LRRLAKNKTAMDNGELPSSGAAQTTPEQRGENRDAWAEKHCGRARDMLGRKKFPEAETAIKEAIRLCPNNATYTAVLAEIHYARGWKTLAQTAVQTALKMDPKNHEAKTVELKLKAGLQKTGSHKAVSSSKEEVGAAGGGKKGFLDQLKEMLNKKI